MRTIQSYLYRDGAVVPATVTGEVSPGIGLFLTGIPDTAVKESLLRTAAALQSRGYHIPGKKITLTVSPESSSGDHSLLDAAIAAALAMETCEGDACCAVAGELALDGTLRDNPALRQIADYHRRLHPDMTLLLPATESVPEEGNVRHVRDIAEMLSVIKTLHEGTENAIRSAYTEAMALLVDTNHPLAAHLKDDWRDTVRGLHTLWLEHRRAAEDWRKRVYAPNSRMVTVYDSLTRSYIRQRADECNEIRRQRMVAELDRKAREVSGFAGSLLARISPTDEARRVTRDFLAECRKTN